MDIMTVVKEHPVPIGIGVVVILLIVFSRGSSNGAAPNNAGTFLQAQSIAANSNATIAEITMRGNVAQGQQSVERNRIAMDAATARTGQVAGLFATMVGTGAQVRMATDSNAVKSQQQMLAANANMLETSANLSIARDTVAAGIKVNADKLAAQQRLFETDANYKLNALGLQTNGDLRMLEQVGKNQIANINAQGTVTGNLMDKEFTHTSSMLDKNLAYSSSTLPSLLQHQQTMLGMQNDIAYQLASIQTAADRKKAEADARKTDSETGKNWVKTVASIFALFA